MRERERSSGPNKVARITSWSFLGDSSTLEARKRQVTAMSYLRDVVDHCKMVWVIKGHQAWLESWAYRFCRQKDCKA
jgi:hypothetical protein